MPGLGGVINRKLWGPDEDEKRRVRGEWDSLVEKNPDLARTPEEYNRGFEEYQKNGRVPTQYPTGNPLRVESGPRVESPLPNGGTAVQFPTTEVMDQPEYRPLRMGQTTGYVSRTDPGQVIMPAGQDKADKLVVLNDQEDKVAPGQAFTYMYDDKTGKVVSRTPTVGRQDKWIAVGERAGRTAPKGRGDSAQTKYYLQVLASYRQALMKGSIPEELTNQAYDAADKLGLPTYWESDIEEPGFLEKMGAYFSHGPTPAATETRTPRIGKPKASQTGELPPQAMDAIQKANGKTVTFQNGRKYRWENSQAVEVQ